MTNSKLDIAAVERAVAIYEENSQSADLLLTLVSMGAGALRSSINVNDELNARIDDLVGAAAASSAQMKKMAELAHKAADIVLGLPGDLPGD